MRSIHYTNVLGAPVQPGDHIRVVRALDVRIHDVSPYVGMFGRVEHLDYRHLYSESTGYKIATASFPEDPMIGIRFPDGSQEAFWKEEISRYAS